jgi:hypothetical protein
VAALLAALPGAAPGPGAAAGVKFGDAVPAIIKPSDLERIRGILRLDRFSIIAAVWLGASAGREAVLIEPLPDDVLARVAAACEEGGFCPDPTGFVAARVRIILLRGGDVSEIVRVDGQARAGDRLLFDPADLGAAGDHLGWTGWAEGRDGHVALSLTPIARFEEGVIGAGADPPFLIRWNRKTDRFALYDCVLDEAGRARCAFREPPP